VRIAPTRHPQSTTRGLRRCPDCTGRPKAHDGPERRTVVPHLHTIERDDELFEAAVALPAEARVITGAATTAL